MILKQPSHLNLTHLEKHAFLSLCNYTSSKNRSPTTIALRLQTDSKISDESSKFSDLPQEQSESTSFTNIFTNRSNPTFYFWSLEYTSTIDVLV